MRYIINVIDTPELEIQKIKCSRYIPTLKNKLTAKNKQDFISWINKSIERVGYM